MTRITTEGVNCWRRVTADRVAFLFDAAPYFEAFAAAVERAERSVVVLGWDIDTRLRLRRPERSPATSELGPFLDAVVSRRPSLDIYLLCWDYALIYALEREWVPVLNLGLRTRRRIHFQFDDNHPAGASHHQKVVVVDDAIAFAGGLDLTSRRWDTSQHRPDDPLRVDARGEAFDPFHDVQLAVSGPAARALGDLARDRWQRATGKQLPSVSAAGDPWPPHLRPDIEDVEVAIARTEPVHRGRPGVREVEQLYLDSIAAARRSIYIESQYLTAKSIREALARRLREPGGPEVIIVGPREASGWLENGTMNVLRARVLKTLQRADKEGRLRAYYPVVTDQQIPVYVHSKLMVVDDTLLRVGSSNLSNRSMGLDTECDLAIESDGKSETRAAIARFRDELLAEHLGLPAARVAEVSRQTSSLIETIEELRGSGERDLVPLAVDVPEWLERTIPLDPPFDPPGPVSPERLFEQLVPEDVQRGARRRLLRGILVLALMIVLAAAWHWTPLGAWIDPLRLAGWAAPIRDSWLAPLIAILAFVAGGIVLFPLMLLIVYSTIVFGPIPGFLYSLAGAMASAALGFWVGRRAGRGSVRRLAGSRLNRISRGLARGGVLGVVAVRLLPVAPYTVVNIVAGASHIRRWEYFVGTAIGLLPGMIALTLLGTSLEAALRSPGPGTLALLFASAIIVIAGGLLLRRWLGRRGLAPVAAGGDPARRRPEV